MKDGGSTVEVGPVALDKWAATIDVRCPPSLAACRRASERPLWRNDISRLTDRGGREAAGDGPRGSLLSTHWDNGNQMIPDTHRSLP